jgi:site-specific DNA recombinase
MPKAIGYIRVSTSEQATDGVSLEAQRTKITAWAVANDYEIVAIYEDAGITGTSLDKRPGLKAAIEQTGKGMALVAYSISRIARSTRDMLQIADQIQGKGADLVSLTEKIDTTTAAGKMVFRMLAVLSEFERDVIAERTTGALAHKKSKREVYSPVPFGFETCDGRLVPSIVETEVVTQIKSMHTGGLSLRQIAARLNSRGITGKKGGKFHASTIRAVLGNSIHQR